MRRWLAILGLLAGCGTAAACGASVLETQIAVKTAADQACVAQAQSYDAGLDCLATVHKAFCGPQGVLADAGVCQ